MRLLLLIMTAGFFLAIVNGCANIESNPAQPPAPPLAITAPSAGDVWYAAGSCTVRWNSTDKAGKIVRIELRNDTGAAVTIADAVENTGSFTWTPPYAITGGTGYRLTISSRSDNTLSDTSARFTIINFYDKYEPDSTPSLATFIDTSDSAQQHTLSRDDTDWFKFNAVAGVTYCIQTRGPTDTYLALYSLDSAGIRSLLLSDNDNGAGSNALVLWTCATGGTYYFSVRGSSSGESQPYSVLIRAGAAMFAIIAPDSGSTLTGGNSTAIEWAYSLNSGSFVSLSLYRDDSLVRAIVSAKSNNGYFSWIVPSTVISSAGYRIKIVSDNDASMSDFSDRFTISNSPFSIAVTAPDTSTQLNTGGTCPIRWTRTGNVGNYATLTLYDDTFPVSTIADSVSMAGGYFAWPVPTSLTTSNRYRIRVTCSADTLVSAFSGQFSITKVPTTLTITAPGAAATWNTGAAYTISWTASGIPAGATARLELFDSTALMDTIALNTVLSAGQIRWTVPVTLPSSAGYRIKITSTADTALHAFGFPFAIIKVPAAISVTVPGASTVWSAGSPAIVYWSSSGPVGSSVSIGLYQDSALVQSITGSTYNNGAFQFSPLTTLTGGDRYRIKVASLASPSVYCFSDYFTIQPVPVVIIVTAPKAGSAFTTGLSYIVSWTSTGPLGPLVKVDLYDSSLFVQTLSDAISASASPCTWTVPLSLHSSGRYRIKVTSTSSEAESAFSEYFSITQVPATIAVTAPSAGVRWNAGTTNSCTWTSSGNVPGNAVTLLLCDTTAIIATIASGVSCSAGVYEWTLPTAIRGGDNYRVKLVGTNDSTVFAFSGYFTIIQQPNSLRITAPTSSSNWEAGSYYSIYWSSTGAPGPAAVLDLYDSSAHVLTISANLSIANNSLLWLVPASLRPDNRYRIRIKSLTLDTVFDYSDNFTITNSARNDAFEPDSVFTLATAIAKGGAAQDHTLANGDQDWFSLTATGGVTYVIETHGATDTWLDLFSTNGTTLLMSDDDGGSELLNARITWTPVASGIYYFRVKGSAGAVGEYTVTVR
jgi:hypothetical protein